MQRGWSRVETVGVLVLLVALLGLAIWQERVTTRVALGMTRVQAVTAIGRLPDRQEHELSLCAADDGWRGDCAAAKSAGAVSFMLWRSGPQAWVVLGLDGAGKVCYRGEGELAKKKP